MKSPIPYFGGKHRLARRLIEMFPAHEHYCEPFFGGGSVFFAKTPCQCETINDADEGVTDFFRVLRDDGEKFIERAELTEYNEALYYECRATWQGETDAVKRAWAWWVVATQSFAGKFEKSHGHAFCTAGGINERANMLKRRVDVLPMIVDRLRCTQILHGDGLRAMEACDGPNCLHYVDPPYVAATRAGGMYRCEMTDEQHEALVDCLLALDGYVVLSGYANTIYERLERAGWQRTDFSATCSAAGRTRLTNLQGIGSVKKTQKRIESVWCSPRTVYDAGQLQLEV